MIASSRCELLRAAVILIWSWVELTQRSWGLFVIWHYVTLGSRTRGTVTQCFSFNHKSFFYPFSYQEKMSFCESRKNRLDLNKISFQKTCLSKPGQYNTVRLHLHCTKPNQNLPLKYITLLKTKDTKYAKRLLCICYFQNLPWTLGQQAPSFGTILA